MTKAVIIEKISGANQWTGFYMITASVMEGLKSSVNIQPLDALMRLNNIINSFSVTQVQDIKSTCLKRGKKRIQLA